MSFELDHDDRPVPRQEHVLALPQVRRDLEGFSTASWVDRRLSMDMSVPIIDTRRFPGVLRGSVLQYAQLY